MEKLVLMDWEGKKVETPIDLDDLSEINQIEIRVISGDETAIVGWKDGKHSYYDSSSCRLDDFFDYQYMLVCKGRLVIDRGVWLYRANSYAIDKYMQKLKMKLKGEKNG